MDTKFQKLTFYIANLSPNFIRRKYFSLINLCPPSTSICRGLFIDEPSHVKIGENGYINHNVQFTIGWNDNASVTIGNNVFIAPNVCFYCVSHNIGESLQRAGKNRYSSINVEDGVWIGANAVVLQSVTIGKGSIICAGAVVNRNIPANEMWGGVPARFIKKLD